MRNALLASLLMGCLDATPPEGVLRCAPAPDRCPAGYACAPDQTCWRVGNSAVAAVWEAEQQSAWSGPAATRIALSALLPDAPTQDQLAADLGTTAAGINDVGLVRDVLNRHLSSVWYERKDLTDPPSQAQRDLLKQDVVRDIDHGYPIVANVVSGFRPPGYPMGTIRHYVVIIGYAENGARVLIADPGGDGAA